MNEPPDPQEVDRVVRVEIRRYGHGAWRIASDLEDAARDCVVDRVLRIGASSAWELCQWLAYARAVCRNLVRSGPGRTGLLKDRFDDVVLDRFFAAKPDDTERDRLNARSIDWSTIDLVTLTEFERRTVNAMRTSHSMAEAAVLADMTVRDLRNRSTRAAAKLARLNLNPRRRAPD